MDCFKTEGYVRQNNSRNKQRLNRLESKRKRHIKKRILNEWNRDGITMNKVCRLCKRYVAGQSELCSKCYEKLPESQKKDIELQQKEKRGIYSCTLETFI